jgi:hypothetical protein
VEQRKTVETVKEREYEQGIQSTAINRGVRERQIDTESILQQKHRSTCYIEDARLEYFRPGIVIHVHI